MDCDKVIITVVEPCGEVTITVNECFSPVGSDGKSAYQVAVDDGFIGTESEWLESIRGDKGESGFPELSQIQYPDNLSIPDGFIKVGESVNGYVTIQMKSEYYIIKVKTDNAGVSSSNQFTFPATGSYTIDWGDGLVESKTGSSTHTYADISEYVIKVKGGLKTSIFNNGGDKKKLIEIINWGDIGWSDVRSMFYGCSNMIYKAFDAPNLSNVTDIRAMFYACTSLIGNKSISEWDVSTVTYARTVFSMSRFNQDISNLKFSQSLTTMEGIVADSGISRDNYNLFIIGMANWAYDNGGVPTGVNWVNHTGLSYTNEVYNIDGQFNNAQDALQYLTVTLNWDTTTGIHPNPTFEYVEPPRIAGQFDNGKLILGFDDGYIAWNDLLLPLFDEKDVKATFFVSPSYMIGGNYSTWPLIKELYDAGHNIENHTLTHDAMGNLDMSEKETLRQIYMTDKAFIDNDLPKSMHLAYPFGSNKADTRKWLREGTDLKTARKTKNPPTDGLIGTDVDKFAIPSFPLSGTIADLPDFKNKLDAAMANKQALCVYGHRVVTTDGEVQNLNYITVELLTAILDYCATIGVDVITHEDLYYLLD